MDLNRKAWEFTLVKRLYEAGYSRSDVLNLFKFVDWLMILLEGLKQTFWAELKTYEEERKMPYITSVEQIGYDRGLQAGEEKGQRSLVINQLTRKVGSISDQTLDRVNALSSDQLESLGEALLDFGSIDDLAAWLENQG